MNGDYCFVVLMQILLSSILFPAYGVYNSWRGKRLIDQLLMLLKAWGLSFLFLFMIGVLTKTSGIFSREWLIDWAMVSAVLLLAVKLFIYRVMQAIRKRGNNERRVVYVGSSKSIKEVKRRIMQSEWAGFKSVAWVSVYKDDKDKELGIEHVHGIEHLEQVVADYRPDELWIVSHISDLKLCTQVNRLLSNNTVNIRYIPDLSGTGLLDFPSSHFLGLLTWDISVMPITEGGRLLKLLEDKLLGLVFCILLSPFMLLIAIGVKLSSPGPVLFKQLRHGWDGDIIKIYKFRSMIMHQEPTGIITQATKNDPRTTKLGAFLRRTNLDELPQFYNVLQGRMSIVGPRPHALSHNKEYSQLIDEYMRRHKVKPGITGWAQVNGWRGETDTLEKMKNRVDCDFYYIRNWSLWLDLKIILLTVLRAFVDKNAY